MKPTPMLDQRARRSTDALLLIAFCGFLFLLGLQVIGLVGADEPRYAQVAREMLARHDWVTPYLYGQPWLEKPPLYYWCAMLAYKASGGVTDIAARLPNAMLSALLIFFIYVWSRRFRPGTQLDAALITASAAMIVGFARGASTDMPLAVMFTTAMLSWYGWHASGKRRWLLSFYFFLALGTLAKGPVAILLAAAILGLFAALRRDRRLILRSVWPAGIALFLAVATPWYVAVQRANPGFLHSFFVEQNLARFSTDLYHHVQPFWYFVPVALIGLVPWTVFVIHAVVDAIRDWRFSVEQPAGAEDFRTYLSLWLLAPTVFFSLSHSKLPGYILPAVPAGTILLADFIRRREEQAVKPAWWMIMLHALLSAAMVIAAFVMSFKLLHMTLPTPVMIVAASLAIVTILMFWLALRRQGYAVLRFVTLIPLVIAFSLILRGTAPVINFMLSERPVAQTLAQTELGGIRDIAVYNVPPDVAYGLAFYRNHPVADYDRGEIPAGDHIVVAAMGSQKGLEARLPGRTVVQFGGFQWQHLEFFAVTGIRAAPQQR